MTIGEKLCKLRKENNITQEQLADILGVSRQSVSKWESDIAFPETDKLIKMSKLFGCSIDSLLVSETDIACGYPVVRTFTESETYVSKTVYRKREYEYRSKTTVFGLPLVHISFVRGKPAKGIIAIGFKSAGVLSLGFVSLGLLSLGIFAVGLVALGVLGVGLLIGAGSFGVGFLGVGAISFGIISFGSISVGIMSGGAISIGQFAVGALARGQYFAFGDNAAAMVAIGATRASGTLYSHFTGVQNNYSGYDAQTVISILESQVPSVLKWLMNIALSIVGIK